MNIQQILQFLRTDIGMTQVEIQRETGISQFRICRWGAGQVASGADDALKLLDFYQKAKRLQKKAKTKIPAVDNALG